jgi:uncharacterized protein (TIGR00106 family)
MKDSVIADIRVMPFGTETVSVSHLIAATVNLLEQADDIQYQITPMATIVEGPLDRILELMKEMHELPFSQGVDRVVTSISIDDRRDKRITMDSKVKAVKDKLSG